MWKHCSQVDYRFRRVGLLITLGQSLYYSLVILVMSGRKPSGAQSRKRKKMQSKQQRNQVNSTKPFSKNLSQTNLSQKTMISWLSLIILTRLSNNRKGIGLLLCTRNCTKITWLILNETNWKSVILMKLLLNLPQWNPEK